MLRSNKKARKLSRKPAYAIELITKLNFEFLKTLAQTAITGTGKMMYTRKENKSSKVAFVRR